MDFDKLLEIVIEKNKVDGEKCLICHFPDDKNNLEKLSCSHYFHLNCLNIDKTKKSCKIVCPYCGAKVKIRKKNEINITKETNNTICKVILKSGVNKRKECGRCNCKYHKLII